MQALTVHPLQAKSAEVSSVPDPNPGEGSILVRGRLLGICGTDIDIVGGNYGWSPEGTDRLILGHESFGEVLEAPTDSGFSPGDLVVGIVRRPDPVPCSACAVNAWDFCDNGEYTERGIKSRHGYGSQHWRVEPEFAIRVDASLGDAAVLVEPTSVVAKAWEQTEILGRRTPRPARTVLVTGAGPIGLLAALLGHQRGLDVHVFDQMASGTKPELVKQLGATYHYGTIAELKVRPDIVIECTGYGPLVFDLPNIVAPDGIICLTGISSGSHALSQDPSAINKELVLQNTVVFGSVNASRDNYLQAASALAKADIRWLSKLISRRVPLSRALDALDRQADDVKVVIDLTA